MLFIYLTYSLLLLILHQERGGRLCAGSDENGREEQPRMRRCAVQKPEVCKMHPILISISYCCTVFLTTFIIPPDSCAQGGLTTFLALLTLLDSCSLYLHRGGLLELGGGCDAFGMAVCL